ncbi:hypothetical protein LSH36_1235g00035 [Paralvinella palmiformis]|uniref:EF-hand domain-containing protein n=1 Tax=Paralvinella palmiformis TaxID=53620 RepID=A0AAD9MP16_9ANNE|nr:hypothetical protein LSH36_1235g00035 [Paralvinella palmiformis]
MSAENLREFFDAADKDKNGCISTEELLSILTKAFDGDRQKALSVANEILKADVNRDKKITWEELLKFWSDL